MLPQRHFALAGELHRIPLTTEFKWLPGCACSLTFCTVALAAAWHSAYDSISSSCCPRASLKRMRPRCSHLPSGDERAAAAAARRRRRAAVVCSGCEAPLKSRRTASRRRSWLATATTAWQRRQSRVHAGCSSRRRFSALRALQARTQGAMKSEDVHGSRKSMMAIQRPYTTHTDAAAQLANMADSHSRKSIWQDQSLQVQALLVGLHMVSPQ
jgi:hypothetical protein